MLEIRANCELCDVDLPPHSKEARICSYECTYCRNCAETVLKNVCPTCGGGFDVAQCARISPIEESLTSDYSIIQPLKNAMSQNGRRSRLRHL